MKTLKPREEMTLTDRLFLALQLVAFFCRIGCFTFGGGWNIVAQIQKEFVEKRHWLTDQELLDMTAVGRSLPGTMIGNVSYLFGYHLGGILCGVAATLGMLIPPVIILSIVTVFYNSFRDNIYVARAMVGVRASVVPIIGGACLRLCRSAYADRFALIFTAVALILCLFFNVNNILIVLAGAAFALLIQSRRNTGTEAEPAAQATTDTDATTEQNAADTDATTEQNAADTDTAAAQDAADTDTAAAQDAADTDTAAGQDTTAAGKEARR